MPLNRLLLLLTLTLASAGSAGSTLAAAGDITLTATGKEGKPATGKLLIQGSDLSAGHDLSLTAQNDINNRVRPRIPPPSTVNPKIHPFFRLTVEVLWSTQITPNRAP